MGVQAPLGHQPQSKALDWQPLPLGPDPLSLQWPFCSLPDTVLVPTMGTLRWLSFSLEPSLADLWTWLVASQATGPAHTSLLLGSSPATPN